MENRSFFPEFCWAVPTAFLSPLQICYFEEGDTFYDTTKAYEGTWGEALQNIKYSIQVVLPTRKITRNETNNKHKKEDMFQNNWKTDCLLKFVSFETKESKQIYTTQGRLYSFLWKGDKKILDCSQPPPKTLCFSEILRKHLREALPFFLGNPLAIKGNYRLFLIPYDKTDEILCNKHDRLKKIFETTNHFLVIEKPSSSGILNASEEYIPTLYVACYYIDINSQVEKLLKKALYTPKIDKITDREHWLLESHGHLFPPSM